VFSLTDASVELLETPLSMWLALEPFALVDAAIDRLQPSKPMGKSVLPLPSFRI
jgi:hypothetical protein